MSAILSRPQCVNTSADIKLSSKHLLYYVYKESADNVPRIIMFWTGSSYTEATAWGSSQNNFPYF